MSTQTVTMTADRSAGDVVVPDGVAEQLLAAAKAQGVSLTGPGGLLTGLTRQVLESALEAELTEHLGHAPGGVPAGSNMRNGYSAKTLRTEVGDIRIVTGQGWPGSQGFRLVSWVRAVRAWMPCFLVVWR